MLLEPAPRRCPTAGAAQGRRGLRHRDSGRRGVRQRSLITAAVAAVFVVASAGVIAQPAHADDYPSWQDVQTAKADQAAAAEQIDRITALIASLQARVTQTQAESDTRGEEFQIAQEKADAADQKAAVLVGEATDAKAKSADASTRAGQLAASLYRSGNAGITANVLLTGGANGRKADRLLADLGSMSKLVERSDGVYKSATQRRNVASSLAAQANVAQSTRAALKAQAHTAMDAAIQAAKVAHAALAEQQTQVLVLEAQLAALQNTTATTVDQYQAGVAARTAAADAAKSGNLAGGAVGPQGWANPVAGTITNGFGPRPAPCSGCSSNHQGVDIGAACGTTEHAAYAGTVVYAGRLGSHGNYIRIDHGSGVTTAYGHIRDGGILVGIGQRVSAGEPIGQVGSTGASTGCHLHFEVRINGSAINGATFMAQRGAPLG